MLDGINTVSLTPLLTNPQQNPRVLLCFGFTPDFDYLAYEEKNDVVCISQLLDGPQNSLFPNTDEVVFLIRDVGAQVGDNLTASENIYVKNEGNTPLTVYFFAPETLDKRYNISFDETAVFIAPGAEKRIRASTTWVYDENPIVGREYGAIYAIPNGCDISRECADSAKVKFDLEFIFD